MGNDLDFIGFPKLARLSREIIRKLTAQMPALASRKMVRFTLAVARGGLLRRTIISVLPRGLRHIATSF